jgi:hypothetical protein
VEPVFGNLRASKRLDRFTLRARPGRRAMDAVRADAQRRETGEHRLLGVRWDGQQAYVRETGGLIALQSVWFPKSRIPS